VSREGGYENFARLQNKAKNKVQTAGLRVWSIGTTDAHNMEGVTLNLPGRDSNGVARRRPLFRSHGEVRKIHFRNVSAPIPHFVGTFVDIGCMETWPMMRALREVNFDGVVIGSRFSGRVDSGRAALPTR
jgi:hypothetical protein